MMMTRIINKMNQEQNQKRTKKAIISLNVMKSSLRSSITCSILVQQIISKEYNTTDSASVGTKSYTMLSGVGINTRQSIVNRTDYTLM